MRLLPTRASVKFGERAGKAGADPPPHIAGIGADALNHTSLRNGGKG